MVGWILLSIPRRRRGGVVGDVLAQTTHEPPWRYGLKKNESGVL
jgi:hypothetical protein